MQGFFSKEETQSLYMTEQGRLTCPACGLYKNVNSPRMIPFGDFEQKIMVIGEAPGAEEDKLGRPWQGKVGQALQRTYAKLGIDLFRDCISLNSVNCRPTSNTGANRGPTAQEVSCCRAKVLQAVKQYQPKVIILQGGSAVQSIIGMKWTKDLGGVSKWRGWAIPDYEYNAWICPTFHPSYVLRQLEVSPEVEVIWERDLQQAFAKAEEPLPDYSNAERSVVIVTEERTAITYLEWYLDMAPPFLAFDIETTGLKPYNRDAQYIGSIAFCSAKDQAVAFPMPKSDKGLKMLRHVLEEERIGKVAANMKFENVWLKIANGIDVHPWAFDTMQAAHILDNRPGITGLKFQSFVRFGIVGYDDDISGYLKGRGGNTTNRIAEVLTSDTHLPKLLLYNGMDALCTYRLAIEQMTELGMI